MNTSKITAADIVRLRQRAGWTQAYAAATLGVHLSTWAGWEQGRHVPRGRMQIEKLRTLMRKYAA